MFEDLENKAVTIYQITTQPIENKLWNNNSHSMKSFKFILKIKNFIYEEFQFKYYMRFKEIHAIKTVIYGYLDLWSF